jgi:Chagasin family peptidase inhibitor I42
MKKVFVVGVVIAAVMMAGLRSGVADDTKAAVANEASDTDPCRPLTASPGEKFFIDLPANRTTGFSWQIAKPHNEKVVKLVQSKYVPGQSGPAGTGADNDLLHIYPSLGKRHTTSAGKDLYRYCPVGGKWPNLIWTILKAEISPSARISATLKQQRRAFDCTGQKFRSLLSPETFQKNHEVAIIKSYMAFLPARR